MNGKRYQPRRAVRTPVGEPSVGLEIPDQVVARCSSASFPLKMRTVVTNSHRYTRDFDGFETLYDLDADPDELVNLAIVQRDPAARIAAVDALVDELTRADDLTRLDPVGAIG